MDLVSTIQKRRDRLEVMSRSSWQQLYYADTGLLISALEAAQKERGKLQALYDEYIGIVEDRDYIIEGTEEELESVSAQLTAANEEVGRLRERVPPDAVGYIVRTKLGEPVYKYFKDPTPGSEEG